MPKQSESKKITLPDTVNKTVDRRTWMNWVGKAMVLSLGGGLLARCKGPGTGIAGQTSPQTEFCPDLPEGNLAFEAHNGESDFYRNWPIRTVDYQSLESILAGWQLTVNGMVATPAVFSFADLSKLPCQNQITDFHCVEGWSVYDVPWNGVHLSAIFQAVQPDPKATYITFHTINGAYNESLPLEVAIEPKTLLSYGVCNSTLPLDHGFPLRLVVPRMLAYKSAKYVTRIELTDTPVQGYWVARGYPYDAPVPKQRLREDRY